MKKRVFAILAAVLLFFLMSLSIQAYERPPGYENLRVDDQYEGHSWSDIDGSPSKNDNPEDLHSMTIDTQTFENNPNSDLIILIITKVIFNQPIIFNLTLDYEEIRGNFTSDIGGETSSR